MKNKIAILIILSILSIVLAIHAKSYSDFDDLPKLEFVDTITPIEEAEFIKNMGAAEGLTTLDSLEEITTEVETTVSAPDIEALQSTLPQSDIIALARTIQGEAGSNFIPRNQQAAVGWCVLNRYDAWKDRYGYTSIADVCEAPNQFHGYWLISTPRQDMIDLAQDILTRWELEKQGCQDVGRTLPKEYLYFWGDGRVNHFRIKNSDQVYWDWSYANPYA